MTDNATLGMQPNARLNVAHLDPGRTRRDDHVRRQQLVELLVQLLLEVQPFWPVLLDEVDTDKRFCKVGGELQVRLRRTRRKAQPFERRPGRLDELAQRG